MKVDKHQISNTKNQILLGVGVDNKVKFNNHVKDLCRKASTKLHALSRIGRYMTFQQRKTIMASVILAHFGYCPLVWMFQSRKLNHRINRIHERSLRIVYMDGQTSFEDLLKKDGSVTTYHRNIQTLGIELYKVAYGLAPEITKLVFPLNPRGKFVWENIFKTHET